jgi:hypothetical protein
MTATAAFVERAPEPKQDLLEVFRHYKQKFGDDFVLVLTGMHIELQERIIQLEERLTKLEQKRKL